MVTIGTQHGQIHNPKKKNQLQIGKKKKKMRTRKEAYQVMKNGKKKKRRIGTRQGTYQVMEKGKKKKKNKRMGARKEERRRTREEANQVMI